MRQYREEASPPVADKRIYPHVRMTSKTPLKWGSPTRSACQPVNFERSKYRPGYPTWHARPRLGFDKFESSNFGKRLDISKFLIFLMFRP